MTSFADSSGQLRFTSNMRVFFLGYLKVSEILRKHKESFEIFVAFMAEVFVFFPLILEKLSSMLEFPRRLPCDQIISKKKLTLNC